MDEHTKLGSTGQTFTRFAYLPNVSANALFIAILGVYLLVQLGLGVRHRTWDYMGGMVSGLLLELMGYVARIFMHADPANRTPFLMNNICLILGPAFLAASIYLCMGHIVMIYGQHVSRLKPRSFMIVFILCDLTNLILQGVGGAISSTTLEQDKINVGINVIIAGLTAQVVSLLMFIGVCAEFAYRVRRRSGELIQEYRELRETWKWKAFLTSLSVATLGIFIRSAFRIAELSQGFKGPLANDEVTFMVLEGAMIIIATGSLTVFHPGLCFQGQWGALRLSSTDKSDLVDSSLSCPTEERNSDQDTEKAMSAGDNPL